MLSEGFSKTIFQELSAIFEAGNYNAYMEQMVLNFSSLRPTAHYLLSKTQTILQKYPHLVSSATVSQLRNLPSTYLDGFGIRDLIPGGGSKHPEPVVAEMGFPVVAAQGLIRKISVTEKGRSHLSSSHLNLLDQVGSAVFEALSQQLGFGLLWNPRTYHFQILDASGNEDHSVSGASMGLPLALALYSFAAGLPVDAEVSASGVLKRNGCIEPVERIEEKLRVLKQERHYVKRVLVSREQMVKQPISGIRLIRVGNFHEAIAECFIQSPNPGRLSAEIDLKAEMDIVEMQYKQYLLDSCIRNATLLISHLKSGKCRNPGEDALPALFTCYWRKGSCYCHKGDVGKTRKSLNAAHQLYREHPGLIPGNLYLSSRNSYGVLLKDVFRYSDAEQEHLQVAEEFKDTKGLNAEKGCNLSSLSQLCLARRQFEEAEKWQQEAIPLVRSDERHRNFGYLAQIYARGGDFEKANTAFAKAKDLLDHSTSDRINRDLPFYHWLYAEFACLKTANGHDAKAFVHVLDEIKAAYPKIDNYIHAQIYKFMGLYHLGGANEKEALALLNQSILFLEKDGNPMYRLLGASVRAERGYYFFKRDLFSEALTDIRMVLEDLSLQKDIKDFFRTELQLFSKSLALEKPSSDVTHTLSAALKSTIKKIPY